MEVVQDKVEEIGMQPTVYPLKIITAILYFSLSMTEIFQEF